MVGNVTFAFMNLILGWPQQKRILTHIRCSCMGNDIGFLEYNIISISRPLYLILSYNDSDVFSVIGGWIRILILLMC